MNFFLEAFLPYLVSFASSEHSKAISQSRERKLSEIIGQEENLKNALASTRSLRDEIRLTCTQLARNRTQLGVTAEEEPIWQLLSDDVFQADLADWLMLGKIEEGKEAKERLLRTMEDALCNAGRSPEHINSLKSTYFDSLENTVFSNPTLANWRQDLSLKHLQKQVQVLRQRAEEAAGVFSPEKQQGALERYCEMALDAWDIIDLSNLPEGDIHIATQKLLLRQLYMPLRVEVEPSTQDEDDEALLERIEEAREIRRRREAGHFSSDETQHPDHKKTRAPVGERLAVSPRIVVLGDPGGGKTTMLRWMATAYLLRHKEDTAFSQVPDTKTLPAKPWIPVLIRCRDLGEQDLSRSFSDFLTQHINKTELHPEEAKIMQAVILERIAQGEALLLVDGLDEITNPRVRMMFCQELERTAARYPNAPIVVTSRIVGYRDMPYRMGSAFEHAQIAELTREDKELFAQRWVEVTEQHLSKDEKTKRVKELTHALHSSDRIDRLTGNPMLLTTLALVKRKVGKLPNKRSKLYAEAVAVLLNWNPAIFKPIEEDEAIPQLEYLAYEMCRRGVQRLTHNEILDLLDKLREEYPNIHAIEERKPQAFLKHLEERSSILIKSGGIWQRETKADQLVWEFRHLTFQEYLAARALLDGRYPKRDKTKTLAEQAAPLAKPVQNAKSNQSLLTATKVEEEMEVPESWREALRLLVADCKDDDVDELLKAILSPFAGEDAEKTTRPRAVLASLCLADEPNVSKKLAVSILKAFTESVQKKEGLRIFRTPLERAAIELAGSIWAPELKQLLMEEFMQRKPNERHNPGGLWAMAEVANWSRTGESAETYSMSLLKRLQSENQIEVLSAALSVMEASFEGRKLSINDLTQPLLNCLEKDRFCAHAAAWAFRHLAEKRERNQVHVFGVEVVNALAKALDTAHIEEAPTKRFIAIALGNIGKPESLHPLLAKLNDPDSGVRMAVCRALEQLGDKQAVKPLLTKLDDQDADVRSTAIEVLGQLGDKQAVKPLLDKLDDQVIAVRRAAITALRDLGDKQAFEPLLAKLDGQDPSVLVAGIIALRGLLDKQHIESLLAASDHQIRRSALGHFAFLRDKLDQRLLSCDIDALDPWLDPQEPITKQRVEDASHSLNLKPEEVRSRYEAMAVELNLTLSWKA